jgi:hypothetical protein
MAHFSYSHRPLRNAHCERECINSQPLHGYKKVTKVAENERIQECEQRHGKTGQGGGENDRQEDKPQVGTIYLVGRRDSRRRTPDFWHGRCDPLVLRNQNLIIKPLSSPILLGCRQSWRVLILLFIGARPRAASQYPINLVSLGPQGCLSFPCVGKPHREDMRFRPA